MKPTRNEQYDRFFAYNPETVSVSAREIDYLDTAPQPFTVQIPLVEYFERVKRLRADKWQHNFCRRLEEASVNRHIKPTLAITHAEAQIGKSVIQAQVFNSWLLGHDPAHRIILATYNVGKSEDHSNAIIQTIQSPLHKDIFPSKDGHIPDRRTAKSKWSTYGRMDINDGQYSFRAVGLQSGITGSGFDTGEIDDPYANVRDAFSETIRKNLQNFWNNDLSPRLGTYSNLFTMFHRYSPDDLAGYLLDTGYFEYWRYATMADGDYIHPSTGQRFPDPLDRNIGEYISPMRRPPATYDKAKKNSRVWLSMYQGRPSLEEGEFFNVGKIEVISPAAGEERRRECVAIVKAWDLAATEAGGDFSVGALMGIRANGKVTVFDIIRKQVETAGRDKLQLETAKKDGADVVITIPSDPAAGGKSTVFHTQQLLKGFEVVPRPTSGSKENRARNFAGAVNSGDVEFVDDSLLPEERQWIKEARREMRDFPLSEHKDIMDATGDGYNESYERMVKGLIIKNYKAQRNVIGSSQFHTLFPNKQKRLILPDVFRVYVGVKITTDPLLPNSAVIVARASANSGFTETLFAVAEYKEYANNFYELFEWLDWELKDKCAFTPNENITIYLHRDSETFLSTIRQKIRKSVLLFDYDELAGITETNWYLMPRDYESKFNEAQASGLYLIVPDSPTENQLSVATDSRGFYNLRQEFATWGYSEKGEPSKIGQVADCLRMVNYAFRTFPTPLTDSERIEEVIKQKSPLLTIEAMKARSPNGKGYSVGAEMARAEEVARARKELELDEPEDFGFGGGW